MDRITIRLLEVTENGSPTGVKYLDLNGRIVPKVNDTLIIEEPTESPKESKEFTVLHIRHCFDSYGNFIAVELNVDRATHVISSPISPES